MINSAIQNSAAVPHVFTLNDLRMQSSATDASSNSTLKLTAAVLALVLAIVAFIWLDPLRLLTTTDASPPAPAYGSSAAQPTERQEIMATGGIRAAMTEVR